MSFQTGLNQPCSSSILSWIVAFKFQPMSCDHTVYLVSYSEFSSGRQSVTQRLIMVRCHKQLGI
ncbi:hypothetical protein CY34DRAFT_471392 [Suillus luteus UH-Slu-Lm8-n1]|uniref:Uncharacterized protein n=1 Tax=Suillus luteus UH-Slu-Lm8-n1 TaxID=930992 RepID=A0A0D0ASF4_9AGAM|nr:hypothetical protein CY34DRAFT_471392 [Suillus luteus UH-Slu-Lm8-n1]